MDFFSGKMHCCFLRFPLFYFSIKWNPVPYFGFYKRVLKNQEFDNELVVLLVLCSLVRLHYNTAHHGNDDKFSKCYLLFGRTK